MRLLAYASYVIGGMVSVVAIVAAIGYVREYGWELDATLGWVPVILVAVGLPVWVGSLLQRAARDRNGSTSPT
jgi:uncharacterized membrane protein